MLDLHPPEQVRILVDGERVHEVLFRSRGHIYSFVIARQTADGHYSCCLSLCNEDGIPSNVGLSRTGNEFLVLSTTLYLLREWIAQHRPNKMSFAARERTRVRLYQRLSRRLANRWGYSDSQEEFYDQTIFTFRRESGGPTCAL